MDIPKNKLGLQGEEMLEVVDFKCDPILIGTLREEPGFFPAYHMSKDSWITVALDVQRIRWQNQNVAWYELWSNDTQNMQKEILINWYVNNRRQDREKHSLPSFDSCPFLWTAHRFLPIEQNRVTSADTVWSFNRFPSSWFYQRFYTLETDSIIYSKVVTCLIEWRVHLISLHSDGCFSVFKFLRSSQHVVSSKR